jgi:uncharacterized protein YbjT (DUF2867 family)
MKILVLGANGKTGKLVVDQAVAMGHEVSVLVRRAGSPSPAGVKVIVGVAMKAKNVLGAMDRHDGVTDCIGIKPRKRQILETDAMRNIAAAMDKSGARKLEVLFAMGVCESAQQFQWWFHYMMVLT